MDMPRIEEFSGERQPKVRITIAEIKKIIAREFGVTIEALENKKQHRSLVRARQVAMFFSKVLTSRSYPEIGKKFGGRDHSTVIHAYRLIRDFVEHDEDWKIRIGELSQKIHDEAEGNQPIQYLLPFFKGNFFEQLRNHPRSEEFAVEMEDSPQNNTFEDIQLVFNFSSLLVDRVTSLVPFVPPVPARVTDMDILLAVAGYYALAPEVLSREPETEELGFYHEVTERLRKQIRDQQVSPKPLQSCMNNSPHYLLNDNHQLMAHDVMAILRNLASSSYIPLV